MKSTHRQSRKEGVPISAWILVGVLGIALAVHRNEPAASTQPKQGDRQPPATTSHALDDGQEPTFRSEARPPDASTTRHVKAGRTGRPYRLSAGPYQSEALAEAFKARIALLGYASSIERYMQDGRIHYRLHLAPFATEIELGEAKRRLREGGVNSLAVGRR